MHLSYDFELCLDRWNNFFSGRLVSETRSGPVRHFTFGTRVGHLFAGLMNIQINVITYSCMETIDLDSIRFCALEILSFIMERYLYIVRHIVGD